MGQVSFQSRYESSEANLQFRWHTPAVTCVLKAAVRNWPKKPVFLLVSRSCCRVTCYLTKRAGGPWLFAKTGMAAVRCLVSVFWDFEGLTAIGAVRMRIACDVLNFQCSIELVPENVLSIRWNQVHLLNWIEKNIFHEKWVCHSRYVLKLLH